MVYDTKPLALFNCQKFDDANRGGRNLFDSQRQALYKFLEYYCLWVHILFSLAKQGGRGEAFIKCNWEPLGHRGWLERAWKHWRNLGEPKLIVAPMVDQSELPFIMLCRKYGATTACTPMLRSCLFAENLVLSSLLVRKITLCLCYFMQMTVNGCCLLLKFFNLIVITLILIWGAHNVSPNEVIMELS